MSATVVSTGLVLLAVLLMSCGGVASGPSSADRTSTAVAIAATATSGEVTTVALRATGTAVVAAENARATATAAKASGVNLIALAVQQQQDKAAAIYVDPRQLVAEPAAYVGRNFWLQGKPTQVSHQADVSGVFLRAHPQGRTLTESISVAMFPPAREILRDECYKIYGIGIGSETIAGQSVPMVLGYAWERVPSGPQECVPADPQATLTVTITPTQTR